MSNSAISVAGLFYGLSGAQIYDVNIASSCTYTYALNKHTYVGGIAAYASNTQLVNCSVHANITVNNGSSTANNLQIWAGGFFGSTSGSVTLNLCSYQGTIVTTAGNGTPKDSSGNTLNYTDNTILVGGAIGWVSNSTPITIDGCYFKPVIRAAHGGQCVGIIFGSGTSTSSTVFKISNIIAIADIQSSGTTTSPDIGQLNGYANGNLTAGNSSNVTQNIYIATNIGQSILIRGASSSNYLDSNPPTNLVSNQSLKGGTKVANSAEVYAKAKTNSNITARFDFLADGTPTPKFAPFFLFYF